MIKPRLQIGYIVKRELMPAVSLIVHDFSRAVASRPQVIHTGVAPSRFQFLFCSNRTRTGGSHVPEPPLYQPWSLVAWWAKAKWVWQEEKTRTNALGVGMVRLSQNLWYARYRPDDSHTIGSHKNAGDLWPRCVDFQYFFRLFFLIKYSWKNRSFVRARLRHLGDLVVADWMVV